MQVENKNWEESVRVDFAQILHNEPAAALINMSFNVCREGENMSNVLHSFFKNRQLINHINWIENVRSTRQFEHKHLSKNNVEPFNPN